MGTLTTRPLRRWQKGERLSSPRLNEAVIVLQDVIGQVNPAREAEKQPNALQADDDNPESLLSEGEIWRFLSRGTRVVRIEDADDAETYVDVEITSWVKVERPDGVVITLELEDPSDG